jgi:uncharacterized membrane protein YfcA
MIMPFGLVPVVLLLGSGALVGATLGLVGRAGSVLAVPLLGYLVGVPSTHVAIGSSVVAVAVNADWGLESHARLGTVKLAVRSRFRRGRRRVGLLSGFFGIGGGFLIVPGLILATGMRLQNAIGTSLFAVTAFGVATVLSFAASGLVDWRIPALGIAGGIFGTLAGAWANKRLGDRRRELSTLFAAVVISAGFYVIGTGAAELLATR